MLGPLVAVTAKLVRSLLQRAGLAIRRAADLAEAVDELGADGLEGFVVPPRVFGFPHPRDCGLHGLGGDVGGFAVVGLGQPTAAHEVLVGRAVPPGVGGVDHPRLAASAVEGAREVVQMLELAVAGVAVSVESLLDGVERLLAHKRRVRAGVLDVLEANDAGVEGVGQHPMDLGSLDDPFGLLGGRPHGEPPVLQQLGHPRDSHVGVGGVLGEGPLHVVRPLVVDLDGADLHSVYKHPLVEVADRCAVDRSAAPDLLLHSLHDLGCEVLRVELGEGTEDAVHQLTLRGLVHVLADRYQRCACSSNLGGDRDIVSAVTRETVDLVDVDRVDVVLADEPQHPLQFWSVC